MRGVLYCGQCGCHSIHGQTLRGLAQLCRINPTGKYAVDTRRMMVTGKARQGIREWPQTKNYPNKELLGRYDLYPDPKGKEVRRGEEQGGETPPPGNPTIYPQEGAVVNSLRQKTTADGIPSHEAAVQPNKTKQKHPNIRHCSNVHICNCHALKNQNLENKSGYLQNPVRETKKFLRGLEHIQEDVKKLNRKLN